MDKAEMVAINHKKLTSAIFHLEAAYKQVGDTYQTTKIYEAIFNTLCLVKARLTVNETLTA